jgi:UDP-N-acetylmuramoyl-tripeptide--D-alanyl-D-alanine ligase
MVWDRSIRAIAQELGQAVESGREVSGFRFDSRQVEPGELFFALGGKRRDGHEFLEEVKARGAVGAVVSRSYRGPDWGLELIRVDDVKEALQSLARQKLAAQRPIVVGVTGSVGKTTTKDFIAALLEAKYRVGKTEGSYNSQLSLPITLLNFRGDEEVLVLEMGMSQPGEIGRLVSIAPPDIGVLTKVALAHVEAFADGILGIAREKGTIFSHSRTRHAIFDHRFHEYPEQIAAIAGHKISFSLEAREADYLLSPEEGWVDERGVRAYQFHLPFRELHIQHNFIAAAAVARLLKLEWDEINRQLPLMKTPRMRFEQFERAGVLLINDAYNANPESMKAALRSFPEPKAGGKRIAVLGTMVELGALSRSEHEEVGRLAQQRVDCLLTYGDEARVLSTAFGESKKQAEHFENREELTRRLKELMRPGDVVLVKASRAMQLESIFAALEE